MNLPLTWFLVMQDNSSFVQTMSKVLSDLEHICIDKDPVSELLLRLNLARYGLLPDQAPKIFGWRAERDGSPCYLFLNEEQHKFLSNLQQIHNVCET